MKSTLLCTFFLLFCFTRVFSESAYSVDDQWETGYHPFPEMNRFLNSHSRIHRPSSHVSFPLLKYLCSFADNQEKMNEILKTFGRKSRPLIMTIIEEDCANYNRRHKRMTININRKYFPRVFLRRLNDHDDQF